MIKDDLKKTRRREKKLDSKKPIATVAQKEKLKYYMDDLAKNPVYPNGDRIPADLILADRMNTTDIDYAMKLCRWGFTTLVTASISAVLKQYIAYVINDKKSWFYDFEYAKSLRDCKKNLIPL